MSPAVPQPINGIINMNAGFYMLPGGSDHVSVDRTETLPKKQKRMAQRRLGEGGQTPSVLNTPKNIFVIIMRLNLPILIDWRWAGYK